jgi:dTDP-4-amino-4,6-dideoxygalactose transaminase
MNMSRVAPVQDEGVPFMDLAVQWRAVAADVRRDIDDIFARSAFVLGPYVDAFESEIAQWLGTRQAIGVNSGTSALHLAMIAAGVTRGDEVLVPAHTFIATAWGALYVGARPVLCDVDEATGTIDIQDARKRLTARTKAIIPVHLYGQPANMEAVLRFSEEHGLAVIEDAAQAIGATWDGRRVGGLGLAGCVSFYPAKNLGAAGEAGLVVTNNDAIAARLRHLRHHGQSERYLHEEIGFNYRLDGLQAAVLRHKLRRLPDWTKERQQLASRYLVQLAGLPIKLPKVVHQDHVWHLFVMRTPERDRLRQYLQSCGIETGLHYPVPLHRQPCFADLPLDRDRFPVADAWARECLSLPLFVGMSAAQQDKVCNEIRKFFAHA